MDVVTRQRGPMELLGDADRPVTGPYRLVAELGRGGMGRVLLGATPDGRLAAVKVMRSEFVEDDGFRVRFRREVGASRRVSGVYTAAVVDADADAPLPWLASVFVPGPTLREVVETTAPLPTEGVVRLAAGLAAALTEIHRAGLVHRDLKPSNVLLAADGPRVIDFGIARATDSEGGTEITGTGRLVGSPPFMSPEQAEGRELTPASDVFSLGAVLVHACTGRSPFAGPSTPQTLYNVVHAAPDLARLPDRMRGHVARCLAKDPSRRPAPDEILELLGRIPPSARPWPDAVHALIDAQHAEIARVLALSQDLGVPVESRTTPAAGGSPDRPEDPPPAPRRPDLLPGSATAELPTQTAAPAARTAPPSGASTARAADGQSDRPGRRVPSRRALLLGALGAGAAVAVPLTVDRLSGPSAAGRSGADPSPSTSPPPTASTSPSQSESPTGPEQTSRFVLSEKWPTWLTVARFSRDGKLIAVGDRDGGIVLRHSPTLEIAAVLSGPGDTGIDNITGDLAFSPDGRLLASVDAYASITLWDVVARKKTGTLQGDASQKRTPTVNCLLFSPDGRTLAFSANRTITLWRVASRERTAILAAPPDADAEYPAAEHVESVGFTRDGRTLVFSTGVGKLRYWDIRKGKVTAMLRGPDSDIAVSPDGHVLAAAGVGEVKLWHAESRTEIETLSLPGRTVCAVAFSPDGTSLAAVAHGGEVEVWSTSTWNPVRRFDPERVEGATESLKGARRDWTTPDSLSFSPDGAYLAEPLDDRLVLWKLTSRT
ncbi:serine/threonine-protein kinase [Streptomyces sp. NPDC046385]|uniref:WD40 repeat domain-containing serine/threonine protein kinase n=1 Tax=Streptomyces sp. NPDC046385 TaxID=3154918 RepID=UPI0033D85D7B